MGRYIVGLRGAGAEWVALDAADVSIRHTAGINRWHAEVEGAQRTGVDAQAQRINLVIRRKDLGEARPAEAHIEDLIGSNVVDQIATGKLHPRGHNAVKSVCAQAASFCRGNRVAERGARLHAVRIKIAARKTHFVVQLVVNLDNEAAGKGVDIGKEHGLRKPAWLHSGAGGPGSTLDSAACPI